MFKGPEAVHLNLHLEPRPKVFIYNSKFCLKSIGTHGEVLLLTATNGSTCDCARKKRELWLQVQAWLPALPLMRERIGATAFVMLSLDIIYHLKSSPH